MQMDYLIDGLLIVGVWLCGIAVYMWTRERWERDPWE